MGEKIITAEIRSENVNYLNFPYNGGTYGYITIRNKNGNLDIIFSVNDGQIDSDMDGASVRVKFDGEKPMRKHMIRPSDGSRNALFFENEFVILKKLKNSKKLVFEVQFFQNGIHQFIFHTENLKWN
jgi:hypothetical protein